MQIRVNSRLWEIGVEAAGWAAIAWTIAKCLFYVLVLWMAWVIPFDIVWNMYKDGTAQFGFKASAVFIGYTLLLLRFFPWAVYTPFRVLKVALDMILEKIEVRRG